ncbi:MAG: DUF692 family multinuclear iron-containing protein [Candidatus Tectimicrobiota bacterium]
MAFFDRLPALPHLGLGISTEYGAVHSPGALDPLQVQRRYPDYAAFLEVGVEVNRGIDQVARQWQQQGLPTTYHFLDVNLDEPEDFDPHWLTAVQDIAAQLRPAWLCGDAGLWHFGRRERGHMLLLPPVFTDASARDQARGIVQLRDMTGYEVLPENPPGQIFLGELSMLEYFARVSDYADTGLLLDCAHLAIYQRATGRAPLDGLDAFPLDRIIEIHVAGGTLRDHDGFRWVDDDHTPHVLQDTWTIFTHVLERAPHLRAVVFECERQSLSAVLPGFRRLRRALMQTSYGVVRA